MIFLRAPPTTRTTGLLAHENIYFNAARLDRSLALNTQDYVRLAAPRLLPITADSRRIDE